MNADSRPGTDIGQSLDAEALRNRLPRLFRFIQLGRCVNGVAHDVNNYLGAMLAYAELASLDTGISDESRRMITEIMDGVTKCSQLINSLTDIARKEKNSASMIDLVGLVNRLLKLRSYALRVDQITVETDLPSGLPSVVADAPKIQLAMLYILMNAQESVEQCSRKVIQLGVGKAPDGLEFTCRDSGDPVPEDLRETIFQPFFSTKGDPHLGLGLSIARSIAELHEGTLTYAPERGFVLYLPRENRLSKNI